MSLAVFESEPMSSRWCALRTWSGLSSGPTSSVRSGTPMSTIRPSVTEVCSRMTATITKETMAPAKRALTSIRFPRCSRSQVPMATTSPVDTLRGRVPPRVTAWRPTSWTVR